MENSDTEEGRQATKGTFPTSAVGDWGRVLLGQLRSVESTPQSCLPHGRGTWGIYPFPPVIGWMAVGGSSINWLQPSRLPFTAEGTLVGRETAQERSDVLVAGSWASVHRRSQGLGLGSTSCACHHTLTAHPLAPSTHTWSALSRRGPCLLCPVPSSARFLKEHTPFHSISHPYLVSSVLSPCSSLTTLNGNCPCPCLFSY